MRADPTRGARPPIRWPRVLGLGAGLIAVAALAAADIRIPWRTVDAGGGISGGGVYGVKGTAGQPDAGPTHTGGPYALVGGFWRGARNLYITVLFADGFESGNTSAWSSTQPLRHEGGAAETGRARAGRSAAQGTVLDQRLVSPVISKPSQNSVTTLEKQ